VSFLVIEQGIPYLSVATAPSLDGYASNIAAMQFVGVKTTLPAHSLLAIFADPHVLFSSRIPLREHACLCPFFHTILETVGGFCVDWYEKLSDYFPEHEMKHPGQMNDLLVHHEAYKKYETEDFLVMYAEYPTFLFVDYLLVNPNTRGSGVGGKVLQHLKKKGKTIILEVEPPEVEDADTSRRIRFYEKNGFRKADHIEYIRSDDDGDEHWMDVYYWPESEVSEKKVLEQMTTVCHEIHNFRSLKYYGRIVADPDDVLNWVQS
jgi:ribosomal protein S18 acetylase RimI-like enzyme